MNFELLCPPIKPGNENPIFSTGTSTVKAGSPITKLDLPGTCWKCHLLGSTFQTRWTHWTQLLSLFWDKTDSNHVCYSTYLKGLKSKKRTRIYTLRGNFTLDIPWRQYFYWLQLHFLPRCPTWQPRGSPRSEPTQEKNTWNPSEDVELKFPFFFWQFERSQTFAIDYGALDLDYGVSHMWFHGPFTWHKSTWINPSFERFWYSYR